ncbi:hypothetical protein BOTCAL_0180g00110 [Botryotinia calthae]|uniref:Uncharacterized protein n=1 Tax=Botryotinia calthae TaxID=38488 RepID=A0A4Y8D180_9HELO|nr:hypothetical protein BOTCAL_0180g00110 [Botryotinia calthae]
MQSDYQETTWDIIVLASVRGASSLTFIFLALQFNTLKGKPFDTYQRRPQERGPKKAILRSHKIL